MANLKDIAKASGVSLTQVSRALNDYDDVSESTKIKVKEVAKSLGYIKNINASRLAMKNTRQMSVMIQGFDEIKSNEDNILLSFLTGVFNFAEQIDYEAIPYLISKKNKQSYVNYCKSRSINGVIFLGARYDDKRYLELINSDFPTVIVDSPVVGKNKASVLIDNEKYAQMAVNELISKGYKKIAMINGHDYAYVSVNRLQGYKNALLQNGINFDESIVKNAQFKYENAKVITEQLLTQGVDAIFAASDLMAFGALEVIKSKNLNVPGDVALFGFDGLMATKFTSPPLSTIFQDNYAKGYEGAKLLYQILNKEDYNEKVFVQCSLVTTSSI